MNTTGKTGVRSDTTSSTLVKNRTDREVSTRYKISITPVIDADAEQLRKIDQEVHAIWLEIGAIHKRYQKLEREETKPLEERLTELRDAGRRLGPKPKCFGAFTQTVSISGGLQCEGCFFASACYTQEKSTTGVDA